MQARTGTRIKSPVKQSYENQSRIDRNRNEHSRQISHKHPHGNPDKDSATAVIATPIQNFKTLNLIENLTAKAWCCALPASWLLLDTRFRWGAPSSALLGFAEGGSHQGAKQQFFISLVPLAHSVVHEQMFMSQRFRKSLVVYEDLELRVRDLMFRASSLLCSFGFRILWGFWQSLLTAFLCGPTRAQRSSS